MIKRALFFLVFNWTSLIGFSHQSVVESSLSSTVEPENDITCGLNHSLWLCGDRSGKDVSFNANSQSCCIGNKTKLYYTFMPNKNLELNDSMERSISYNIYSSPSHTTQINSSFKLFGPFEYNSSYTSLIEDGLATPLSYDLPGASTHTISGGLEAYKVYVLEIAVDTCLGYIDFTYDNGIGEKPTSFLICNDYKIACENCLPKFQPVDDKYVVSAWVKELAGSTSGALNYTHSMLIISSESNVDTLRPKGQIIDGWQRIEGVIQTNALGNLKMKLFVSSGISYFDDIRVFPYDGSMITYVYDPITLRLMAELDERNYAKIYEYDEEGKLIRVKKETEKGIMTIQENRENSSTLD